MRSMLRRRPRAVQRHGQRAARVVAARYELMCKSLDELGDEPRGMEIGPPEDRPVLPDHETDALMEFTEPVREAAMSEEQLIAVLHGPH
jgi:hypothetical protein